MSKVKFKVTNPEIWLKAQGAKHRVSVIDLQIAFDGEEYNYDTENKLITGEFIFSNHLNKEWEVVLDGAELIHEAIKPSDEYLDKFVKAKLNRGTIVYGRLSKLEYDSHKTEYVIQGLVIKEILEVIEC